MLRLVAAEFSDDVGMATLLKHAHPPVRIAFLKVAPIELRSCYAITGFCRHWPNRPISTSS
jgi:hypothetical protein